MSNLSEESLYDPTEACFLQDALSPDYCPVCGNLDFYAKGFTWNCHWCSPLPAREVKFTQRGKAPEPYGPCYVREPRGSLFTPRQVLAVWPEDFTPEIPKGPSVGALILRKKDRENDKHTIAG